VDVEEPSVEDSYHILKGLKPYFENHHGLKYTDSSGVAGRRLKCRRATSMTAILPDKAIDVIDEAGA
jgi:ATP-dependent Clp protease ATP-binding subunit ClpA